MISLSPLLNLSHNSLTGPLPEEMGKLVYLVAVDISHNFISGNVSDSIRSCRSLQYLSLSHNNLSGQIPGKLGDLTGLQSLDLSSNQLSGLIPDDLAKIQGLQFLDLSSNNLEGEIPSDGVFKNLSRVHLDGNPLLGRPHSSHSGMSSAKLIAIILGSASFVLLIIGLLGICYIRRRKNDKRIAAATTDNTIKGQHRMVSYQELVEATSNFDTKNLLGTGGFSSVYRGVLRDGMAVAVKVLNLTAKGASKSFIAECEALRNVRHRNLVKLVTLCSSWDSANGDFCALVYELMGNGSLEDWIRGRRRHEDGGALSAVERLDIAIDVASAVDYLHNDCKGPVVHCDLKPSNVMLDEEMGAKVGDFGLARLLAEKAGGQDYSTSTHGIKGSIGYIPPEYGYGGKPSSRGDAYSYGIMLLELLTAKSPSDKAFEEGLSLEKWVRSAFPSRTTEVLDAKLLAADTDVSYQGRAVSPEDLQECLASTVKVALSCAVESPEARISMHDALHQLVGIKNALMKPQFGPPKPKV